MKIARVSTVPFFLFNHLGGQITYTIQAGFEVILISSGGPETEWLKKIPGVKFQEIDIPRRIAPIRDLLSLWNLYRFFRKERFDIVHSTTPKAGMLCAIAARLAGVPIRLHTFTGQAWVEMHGILRLVSKAGDWLTSHLNTLCYADSQSQRTFILSEGIGKPNKIRVLGTGSLSGVDLVRFNPERWGNSKESLLRELEILPEHKVITFIGRITRDKGVNELLAAFRLLRRKGHQCVLLMIGPGEAKDGSFSEPMNHSPDGDIRYVGYSPQPERYLSVTDIFCLPSYREGFGNVVIEAAAMGVPTVGTDIVGLRDAIINGETGILVPVKNIDELANSLESLLVDDEKRLKMGLSARLRAEREFSSEKINQLLIDEYCVFDLSRKTR